MGARQADDDDDDGLDPGLRTLRDAVRRFLSTEVEPTVADFERRGEFDWTLPARLRDFGMLGGFLPEAQGGVGLSHAGFAMLMEEAGASWGSLRATLNTMNMAALMLAKLGTPAQQARWLAPLLAGRIKVWVGITEPDHGSDVASMRTRATRRGDDWVIDGRKLWITNGAIGDLGILMARAVGEDGAPGGITAFLVDPTESRFEARRVHTMVLKATVTSELTFDGTVVPGANVLGGVGEGLRNILVTLGFGRLSVAAGAVGAMRRAYELAHAYALSRTQFGAPIGGFQLVQQMIVEMHLRLESSRQMLRRAARALDAGRAGRLECSTAKLYCTRAAHEVANLALQVHGGIGYSEDLPIERIFRDTRGAIIPEGTSEIQTLIIGRELLGLSALEPPHGATSR